MLTDTITCSPQDGFSTLNLIKPIHRAVREEEVLDRVRSASGVNYN